MALIPPLLLHYFITYRCNCRCQFCDIWRIPKQPDAGLSEIKENLLQAKQLGVRFVDFTGGEPLLHEDLPEMLDLAKKNSLHTTVTTNAIHYPDRAKELRGKINFLHFSLDAVSADAHDRLRGTPCFARVLQSLDLARSLGETPDILFTATRKTLVFLPQLVALSKKLRLILIVNPIFSARQEDALNRDDLCFLEQYKKRPYVYINKAFNTLRRRGGNNISKPRCRAVQSTIVISPDNKLLLPCFHHFQTEIKLHGNLRDSWLKYSKQNHFSQQGRLPSCAGCVLNCYFDPSFCFKPDLLFLQSLSAKIKYSWDKYILRKYHMLTHQMDDRPAKLILNDIMNLTD